MSTSKSAFARASLACAAAACLFGAATASAITFTQPGFTQSIVAAIPGGPSNHFGGVVEGADGNAYVVGGFRTDAFRVTPGGTVTPLTIGATANLLGVGIVGNTLYAGQDNGRIDTLDISLPSPTATFLATIPGVTNGNANADFALAPAGFGAFGGQLIASNGGVYAVHPVTGAKTTIFAGVGGQHYSALDFGPNGTLYLASYDTSQVLTVTAAGVTAVFATLPGANPDGLAVHPGTGDVYVGDSSGNQIFKITPGGVVTTFATGAQMDGGYYPSGMAFSRNGTKLYYLTNEGSFQLAVIQGFSGVAPPAGNPVPALGPAGLVALMALLALAAFAGLRRARG